MKRWGIWLLCAVLLIFSSGGVDWHRSVRFHPEEHLNTRWVCQEIEGYFDVFEYRDGIRCEGKFNISGEQRIITFQLGTAVFHMQFKDESTIDENYHHLTNGAVDEFYKDGVLTITMLDDGYFDPILQCPGKTLTFIQADVSSTTTTSTATIMTKTVV